VKFKIGDRIYDGTAIDELSLKMLLELEQQTKDFGRTLTMNDIQSMSAELDGLKTDKERSAHPSGPWFLAVAIWAARKVAGEAVSFSDAIDFPLKDLTFLPDPQDHKVATGPKAQTRKGSARAAKPARTLPAKTSAQPSTND
jgi:hypothetical protein